MPWSGLIFSLLLAVPASGIWTNVRSTHTIQPATDQALWTEYGLQSIEQADFGKYKANAYRFRDTTGSYAGYVWLKSTDPSARLEGNVVITCSGACPAAAEMTRLLDPKAVSHAPGSVLQSYLPKQGIVPNSERYVMGEQSLQRFLPGVPSSAMAFPFSTEASVARYKVSKGEILLAVASYPTPSIARKQAEEFRKIPNAVVKRSGPLVAVVLGAAEPEAAQAALAGISYLAAVSWDEKPPDPRFMTKLMTMFVSIGKLILFLVFLCVIGGLVVGGGRALRRRMSGGQADEEGVILLHLADK